MLKKFLRGARRPARPAARIPAGERIYAIGDIHGRLDLLDRLLTAIDADDRTRDAARTRLVFLGDLVDRGPESAGVVERLRTLAVDRPDTAFLAGNHEEMFLAALAGDAKMVRIFCRVGGRETALSYGLSRDGYEGMDYAEVSAWLAANVPATHIAFLERFEDMVTIGDYLFVHAGIRPGVALTAQRPQDLRWIRDPFLDHDAPLDHMVIHGHTITEAVDYRPHRIGIDTGAYAGGPLTAIGLEADQRWELSATDC